MVALTLAILSQNPSLPRSAFRRQRQGASVWSKQPLIAPVNGPFAQ